MLNDLFQAAWKELSLAASGKQHPFNFFSLATMGKNAAVRQRTVILRGISENKSLLFYTDLRSTKIKQLEHNSKANCLFYDPANQLQLVFKGNIIIHTDNEAWEEHKYKIEGKAVNNYNSLLPPGKPIKNPLQVERTNKLHFALLEFIPVRMEYLKLKEDSNHLRARFRLDEGNWKQTFLVP
ncbi:pyridoxine/pyridoxamine 5'-phosphate oxidase [Gillisia mitskevichiae]|uniref:Pyridoxine/pyridoxamine 5'-phosphate oxidase n=1 Tax=Gillisia mitskevichiae TaxID=270921 RepID=A0A495PSG3_9FLAO|nr:pyridoxamine 5'-phosphate oxidase family protein [Gillisia mitskevichiae]RKS53564.1 pyridoxine/pyridoxamine 5'-phosphate oxidase [Gillisia mitskevichiae]